MVLSDSQEREQAAAAQPTAEQEQPPPLQQQPEAGAPSSEYVSAGEGEPSGLREASGAAGPGVVLPVEVSEFLASDMPADSEPTQVGGRLAPCC